MNKIIIIGGITADIEGHPREELLRGESNPGRLSVSYGGVGRNIAENLARMKAPVEFHSVVGDDLIGRNALAELAGLGVDVSGVRVEPEESTAMYLSILDFFGDLELALCNMDALEKISPDFLLEIAKKSKDAGMIALDANLTEAALEYATECFAGLPLFLDPVSAPKAEHAKKSIGKFHTIKPNRTEAEVLTGMEIMDLSALERAGDWFLNKGVKRIFVTLSAGGVYYCDEKEKVLVRPSTEGPAILSATGAGDAFSAAILYGTTQGFDTEKLLDYAMAAASLSLEARTPVHPQLTVEAILQRMKEKPAER